MLPDYQYCKLSNPDNIRLLRLLPGHGTLRCELYEYVLKHAAPGSTRSYEALSYAWGSDGKQNSLRMGDRSISVTSNLAQALLRLRQHSTPRLIWVDALCIHQQKEGEKQQQIQLMAEIYARASDVIVWLGDGQDGGESALESIRIVGESVMRRVEVERFNPSVQMLLKRHWFQRIWVLQEVAAARHIRIMCGAVEIDAHAFCAGLKVLHKDLVENVRQVVFLMEGAAFRSRLIPIAKEKLTLNICPLAELVDMYHTHKATQRHDKVYALLGMSSDDVNSALLTPNYSISWTKVMQNLVHFLLGGHVSVHVWDDNEVAIIQGYGTVLGNVSSQNTSDSGIAQELEIVFKKGLNWSLQKPSYNTHWTLPRAAKSIRTGDLICILKGSSHPTIVRLHRDHFAIIRASVIPPTSKQDQSNGVHGHVDVDWKHLIKDAPFAHEFLLIWDWRDSSENDLGPKEQATVTTASYQWPEILKISSKGHLDEIIRAWNTAQILGNLGQYETAERILREPIEHYQAIYRDQYPHGEPHIGRLPESQEFNRRMLWWAAKKGHDVVVKLLLSITTNINGPLYGQTPLCVSTCSGIQGCRQTPTRHWQSRSVCEGEALGTHALITGRQIRT